MTPAPVTGVSQHVSNLTTASFTPPAGSLLVADVPIDVSGTPTVSISDSGSHTWTLKKQAYSGNTGSYLYEAPIASSGAITVTVTIRGTTGWSGLLDVRVLDNTAASQSGAGSSSALFTGTGLNHPITTTTTGSWVEIAANANDQESTVTPLSTTTTGKNFQDSTGNSTEVSGKQANATGTPGSESVGWTVGTSTQLSFVAQEVLPATTCGGGGGGTHFMDFGPSAACPDGSGSGCGGNPNAYPLSASTCASTIVPDTTERIPENATQNATMGPSTVSAANYGPWTDNSGEPQMERDIQAASGQYTGTTDDILEWAACSEGWNENWLRAESVVESSWQQSEQGDSGCSQGILQVRACQNPPATLNDAWGGYPDTHTSTAFAAEMQASYLRACFDGSIDYLYPSGQTVSSLAAAHGGGANPTGAGWQYVAWGCVGSWFSGDWYSSAAQSYISAVQSALSSQSWNGLS